MEDDKLKNILKESQVKASEHFTQQVMYQIETAQALKPQKEKTPAYFSGNTFGVLGIMYGLILLAGGFLYFYTGSDPLESITFLKYSGLIASVCGVFYLISVLDDSKRYRHKSS